MKIVALALMIGGAAGAMDFEAFRQPAKESHPETWFHVIGGNASKAGMKDDLAAIKAAGISGIQFFHGQSDAIWPGVKEPIPCPSPAWDDLEAYMADECARLGLSLKVQDRPRCSTDGGLGQPQDVAAEVFANFPLTWNETFQMLKAVADRHFARGVTHCVFHTYTHNPIPGRRLTPGGSFGGQPGVPFLRNQTWWKFMPDFTTYLARCGTLLKCGKPVVDVSAAKDIVPDVRFAAESVQAPEDFMWCHRTDGAQEIYFVAAAKKGGFAENVTFRATGKAEIWDPVTGTRSLARVVGRTSSDTTVRVELAESGSAFVVFTAGESAVVASQTPKTIVQPLAGALWRIDFGCNSMTPEAVTTRQLVPWKDMFDDSRKSHSARARAYSGTATYNTTFVWRPTSPVGRVTLDLGAVEAWAEVTLNGKRMGTLWCRPYAVDVTDALQDGINELSIVITSTWHNKLLFQARLPECERDAWTTWRPDPGDEYSPSGLLGPVKLMGQVGE